MRLSIFYAYWSIIYISVVTFAPVRISSFQAFRGKVNFQRSAAGQTNAVLAIWGTVFTQASHFTPWAQSLASSVLSECRVLSVLPFTAARKLHSSWIPSSLAPPSFCILSVPVLSKYGLCLLVQAILLSWLLSLLKSCFFISFFWAERLCIWVQLHVFPHLLFPLPLLPFVLGSLAILPGIVEKHIIPGHEGAGKSSILKNVLKA